MPDMNLNAKSLLTQITNDVKMRSLFEGAGGDLSNNSQFLDVMMARLTALGSTDSDLKALLKKAEQSGDAQRLKETAHTQNLKGVRREAETRETAHVSEKSAVMPNDKARIKERIKEIARRHDAPVTDDRALKTLQKVADFLVKAQAEGRIDMPPALVENLKAFLAKGDDFKAFDTAEFMHDFIAAFRSMVVTLHQPGQAATAGADPLEWPPEIMQALQELNMGFFPGMDGKTLDIRDVMQTVKALVNASETSAIDTLNSKADGAILPQDQTSLLTLAPAEQEKPAGDVKTLEEKIADLILESVKAFQEQEKQNAAAKAQHAAGTVPAAASSMVSQTSISTVLASDVEAAVTTGAAKMTTPADGAGSFNFDKDTLGQKADGHKTDSFEDRYQPAQAQQSARQATPIAAAGPAVSDIKATVSANATQAGVSGLTAAEGLAHTAQPAQAGNQSAAVRNALHQAQSQPAPATQQVIVQLQNKAGKEGQISVQLSPAELGRVDVRLTIDRNGQAQATIVADRPETLALLQKDASFLERALQQAGINAQSQNMSFNLREQRQNEFGQSRKRFSRDILDETKPADMALSLSAEGSIISDRRVNYHA